MPNYAVAVAAVAAVVVTAVVVDAVAAVSCSPILQVS